MWRTILPEIRIFFGADLSSSPLALFFYQLSESYGGNTRASCAEDNSKPDFRSFLCVELSSSPLALYDLISKPQEGSTRVSLLGMLVTVLRGSAHSQTVAAPGIFLPFLLRERASGRGGSFKRQVEANLVAICRSQEALGWFVGWVSEHAEISAKRML
jgi:hypothetical protein